VSDWRRAAHNPQKEQKKKVCFIAASPFTSLNIGASGPENVGIQATRISLSRALNQGKAYASAYVRPL